MRFCETFFTGLPFSVNVEQDTGVVPLDKDFHSYLRHYTRFLPNLETICVSVSHPRIHAAGS